MILKVINPISFEKLNKDYNTALYQDALAFDIGKYIRKKDLSNLAHYIMSSKDNPLYHIKYKDAHILEKQRGNYLSYINECIIFRNKVIMYYITKTDLQDYMKIDFYGKLPMGHNGLQFMDWAKPVMILVHYKLSDDLYDAVNKLYLCQLVKDYINYNPFDDDNLNAFVRSKSIIELKKIYGSEWRKISQEEKDILIEETTDKIMRLMIHRLDTRIKENVDNIMNTIRNLLFKNEHIFKIRKQKFKLTLLKVIYDSEDHFIVVQYGKTKKHYVPYYNIVFSNLHLLLFDSLWTWVEKDKYKVNIKSYIKVDKKNEDFNVKMNIVFENSNVILENHNKFEINIDLSNNLFSLAMSRFGMIKVLFSAHTIISSILDNLPIHKYRAFSIVSSVSI